MAATTAGRQLTALHKQAQGRLGAETVAAMRSVWPLLDPSDLDASFRRWLTAVLATVSGQRADSAALAAAYMSAYKLTATGTAAAPVLAAAVPAPAVATSMLVTGPVSIRAALARGVPFARAVAVAEAASAASAMRHALDGGRETVTATVRSDPDAAGYVRVASPRACKYCAGLAGIRFRGDQVFRPHDGCQCTAEPIYQ